MNTNNNFTCPRCSVRTPPWRPRCIHCGADVNPRPLFDPDQRAPESWESWLTGALFVVLFLLAWLVAYFGPWNY